MNHRLYTDNTYRSCSRCQAQLTDPASRECGVGPVCRGKDNHLYAKLIQANIPMAAALFMGTHPEELPSECEERFMKACKTFLSKMEKVQKANDDFTIMKLTGADFRDEVQTIDYILSYSLPPETKSKLINIVRYLGYVGLAAVLSGEASKSKATVWFENGRVFLLGTGCTPGFRKMHKIQGITVPRYRGSKTPYSAPVSEIDAFFTVIMEHWPLFEGDLNDIRKQAKTWTKKNAKLLKTQLASQSQEDLSKLPTTVKLEIRSNDFVLSFKWQNPNENGEGGTRNMINHLKTLPSKERAYNPNTKNWLFRMQHLDAVKKIAKDHYKDLVVLDNSNTVDTNDLEWKKSNPYAKKAHSPRTYYRRY